MGDNEMIGAIFCSKNWKQKANYVPPTWAGLETIANRSFFKHVISIVMQQTYFVQ